MSKVVVKCSMYKSSFACCTAVLTDTKIQTIQIRACLFIMHSVCVYVTSQQIFLSSPYFFK